MKRIIFEYKETPILVNISRDNTTIINSHKFSSIKDMKNILKLIRNKADKYDAIYTRSIFSMVNEWRVHNLLYALGILRSRTDSVDLEINQPWYIKTLYTILSPFYLHFY